MRVLFAISDLSFKCHLKSTKTAKTIFKMLPITSKISTWGDEIYFNIPKNDIRVDSTAKQVFKLGEIAFWNQGSAIAIGFGPTPISESDEIRLISPANHWADAEKPNDLLKLKKITDGEIIKVLKC